MKLTTKILVAGGTMLALAACTAAPVTTTTNEPLTPHPTSVTSSPADIGREKATSAYLGMWSAFTTASATSDWQSSKLGEHSTAIALNKLSQSLYGDRYRGLITKGEPSHDAKVSSLEPLDDPTRIVVSDCSDSSNALKYRTDNGKLADDKPGGRHLINAFVDKQPDGSWKVTDFGVHEVGSC